MVNKIFLLGLFLLSVANVKAQTLTQTDSLTMETMLHNLPEVMVKGSRPIVKAERGMLSYNMPLLLKQLPADNAYEALTRIPGISDATGSISFSGNEVTLIVNGQATTLTQEQLTERLKAMPAAQLAKPFAKLLRLVHGQPVVRAVPWVKADDVVVALYVLPFLVLAVAEIGAHTGNGKILPATIQRGYAVVYPRYEPPVCVKGGLHGKLVMLECEVFFSVPVVGIFRADMFEYRQRLHLLSARLQTSRRQGRRRLPALPFPAPGRGFRIRSGSGQSGLSCRRFSRTLP